ncbi:MAG TPA: aldose epimerase family protein [Phycisphaerae bacterium]|nr:aldose epimerase family protein [Phycisphaerae bacterium]
MPIEKKPFGATKEGHPVDAYTLTNGNLSATILTFGGTITELIVPDKTGTPGDVVLGFDSVSDYEKPGPYFGSLIGRVGNRIAKGRFTLDGKTYSLATNNGPNHLHGGLVGHDKRIWTAHPSETPVGPALKLSLHDAAGTEGYPGNVQVEVTYTLTRDTLRIHYSAVTDAPTPINLTNHTYFNLKDAGKSDILGHTLQVNADAFTPVDNTLIPTGEIAAIKGTAIDFTSPKPIGKDLLAMHAAPGDPPGYDHNIILRGPKGQLAHCATATEPATGRKLEVWTTEPGVQFYTGNFLNGILGKHGTIYQRHHGFCLETQHFPDSVNHPHFPSTILKPGQKYLSTTEFRFGIA